MDPAAVTRCYKAVQKPHYGTLSSGEVLFLQEQIATHRPRRFIEVGTATGLSTGFIARFMEEAAGDHLTSLDYDDRFYGDRSKPVGFLVPQIYSGTGVTVDIRPNTVSLDVGEESFDMGFVDGNHYHPWPTLDTLTLYPRLTGPKCLLHHDLTLFANLPKQDGIGPKFLFDQMPDTHRLRSVARGGNLFALDLRLDQTVFERAMADALSLPWSIRTQLSDDMVGKIRAMLKTHYSAALQDHFEACLAFYSNPAYSSAGVRDGPQRSLFARFVQHIKRR